MANEKLIAALQDDAIFVRVMTRWLDRPLPAEVAMTSRLVDDLELDSLDFLYLLLSIEDAIEQKIEVDPEDYFAHIVTVRDVQQALLRRLLTS